MQKKQDEEENVLLLTIKYLKCIYYMVFDQIGNIPQSLPSSMLKNITGNKNSLIVLHDAFFFVS